ncbi:hypothetical protein MPDQ_006990 [Monascus purpureus]|uniref:Uncharacterized protein n=1 Tax=Monascus purpureus TaxID=5098 RepID=A0A507QT36_MONPU|nr:hypothetical protein MPDQ_006990 [Monascus purpureus]
MIEVGVGNPNEALETTMPARAFELRNSQYDWGYKTTFVKKPYYERVDKPNTGGKALPGSSCLNYYTGIPGARARSTLGLNTAGPGIRSRNA